MPYPPPECLSPQHYPPQCLSFFQADAERKSSLKLCHGWVGMRVPVLQCWVFPYHFCSQQPGCGFEYWCGFGQPAPTHEVGSCAVCLPVCNIHLPGLFLPLSICVGCQMGAVPMLSCRLAGPQPAFIHPKDKGTGRMVCPFLTPGILWIKKQLFCFWPVENRFSRRPVAMRRKKHKFGYLISAVSK